NVDALRIRESLDLLLAKLRDVLAVFAERIGQFAATPTMAFTHIQPAEPTTMGYRLAVYAQDLLEDYQALRATRRSLRGKGFKGAVGTRAAYGELLADTALTPADLEASIMTTLDLPAYPITGQTYPRKQDWRVLSDLAGLANSLYKFAFDLRLLQSPVIDEWHEPFGSQQIGSSAMPFKRNPIQSEKLDSLGRLVASLVQVAWDNAAHSLLERTLDDSANRREVLPVAFLAADEMLMVSRRVISGLRIDETAAARNLERFGLFAAVERVLVAAVKAGADRQAIHEHLRVQSLGAWAAVADGRPNPLLDLLIQSDLLAAYLPPEHIRALLDAGAYVGDAPARAQAFAAALVAHLDDEASANQG
ncbi:MAG: adenylosuccinate lyase, partial [Chloroflexi bacterium]|nr:adenylosuccinate lyase [Chloroflexota bacterium]